MSSAGFIWTSRRQIWRWCWRVASSYRDTPIDAKTLAIGEVGLTGEVRSVTAMQQRLTEAARLGFTRCIVPRHSTKQLLVPEGMELIRVRNIREAIEMAL